jgi:hypothetical protein
MSFFEHICKDKDRRKTGRTRKATLPYIVRHIYRKSSTKFTSIDEYDINLACYAEKTIL